MPAPSTSPQRRARPGNRDTPAIHLAAALLLLGSLAPATAQILDRAPRWTPSIEFRWEANSNLTLDNDALAISDQIGQVIPGINVSYGVGSLLETTLALRTRITRHQRSPEFDRELFFGQLNFRRAMAYGEVIGEVHREETSQNIREYAGLIDSDIWQASTGYTGSVGPNKRIMFSTSASRIRYEDPRFNDRDTLTLAGDFGRAFLTKVVGGIGMQQSWERYLSNPYSAQNLYVNGFLRSEYSAKSSYMLRVGVNRRQPTIGEDATNLRVEASFDSNIDPKTRYGLTLARRQETDIAGEEVDGWSFSAVYSAQIRPYFGASISGSAESVTYLRAGRQRFLAVALSGDYRLRRWCSIVSTLRAQVAQAPSTDRDASQFMGNVGIRLHY